MAEEEKISLAKGAAMAVGFLVMMTVMVMSLAEIIPKFIGVAIWFIIMAAWIGTMCRTIVPRLTPTERKWYYILGAAAIGIVIVTAFLVSTFADDLTCWEIVQGICQETIMIFMVYQLVYLFKTKNRNKA